MHTIWINRKLHFMQFPKTIYAILACIILLSACEGEYHTANTNNTEASATTDTAFTEPTIEREIIKSGEVQLQVENINEAVKDIQHQLTTIQGHVTHYEMNSNKYEIKEVAYSLDSSYIINQIKPNGYMRVRVPVMHADTFIAQMLSMNASIDKILFDEEDVTEDLKETKAHIESSAVKFPNKAKLDEQVYLDEKQQANIHLQSNYARIKYRTSFLWFDIHLTSIASIEKQIVASTKDIREPFYVNGVKALRNGWYIFSIFIVALLHAWPFILLALLMYMAYKRKWLRRLG